MSGLSDKYVIGVDYGTLSGRALLVRVSDGEEVGRSTALLLRKHN
jgi:L-ribulokinase